MIVACDNFCGIGKDNKMPWGFFKKDMLRFKKLTVGDGNNCVVMGRKTFESIPKVPLPGRDNYVLSRTNKRGYIRTFSEIDDKYDEVWIIGGQSIYEKAFKELLIDSIYVTIIENSYECDRFFPFEYVNEEMFEKEELGIDFENQIKLSFVKYKIRNTAPSN